VRRQRSAAAVSLQKCPAPRTAAAVSSSQDRTYLPLTVALHSSRSRSDLLLQGIPLLLTYLVDKRAALSPSVWKVQPLVASDGDASGEGTAALPTDEADRLICLLSTGSELLSRLAQLAPSRLSYLHLDFEADCSSAHSSWSPRRLFATLDPSDPVLLPLVADVAGVRISSFFAFLSKVSLGRRY
jgi:hypothetical protein